MKASIAPQPVDIWSNQVNHNAFTAATESHPPINLYAWVLAAIAFHFSLVP